MNYKNAKKTNSQRFCFHNFNHLQNNYRNRSINRKCKYKMNSIIKHNLHNSIKKMKKVLLKAI